MHFSVFVDWCGHPLHSCRPDAVSQNAELFKSLEVHWQVFYKDQWRMRHIYSIAGNALKHNYPADNIAKFSM
jgi:hypothetical protein